MPRYEIQGQSLQTVVCELAKGEKVIAETGHLVSLTDGLSLETSTGGGIMSGLKRMFGGSTFFINEVSAARPGQAVFSSPSPGQIKALDVTPTMGWLCQPHVFLCADPTVLISAGFTKTFGAGLFGGAGFVLQSLEGQGKAMIHGGGTVMEHVLKPGQTLLVETGALAAFEASVTYDIQMVRGLKSILFSGEGMWFAHMTGPGKVYVQSLTLPRLAHALLPFLPSQSQ